MHTLPMLSTLFGVALFLAAASALAATPLAPDGLRAAGMTLTLTSAGESLTVPPLTRLDATATAELPAGTPGWNGPYRLPRVAWVFRALDPDSLQVKLADDPTIALVRGRDYLLDPDWATLATAPDGPHAPGTRVQFTYQYTRSRLDLLERSADGKLHLVTGEEHMTAPRLPDASPGATPLAGIYLPHNTTQLTAANINFIDPAETGIPPVLNRERLAPIMARLAAGEPTTIVFFGDSITAMGAKDLGDEGSYVDRFARWLQRRYPTSPLVVVERGQPIPPPADRQITFIKAGVGGDDTRRALARLDKDVLTHQPHLVTIMFGVNDENASAGKPNSVPVPQYQENLREIVGRIRDAGAVPVLMTTSMKNLEWVATAGNLHEYANAARTLAIDENVALIDHFAAWQALPQRGYHYMILLGTCINHPVSAGHDLFLSGLQSAFGHP